MANNQKKLKAFVRYDGSGRVVASSLILRKNKPRVGRWYEIPEYLCCNGISPSTTTTTTQGGGGTPTAHIIRLGYTEFGACENPYSTGVYYTSSSVITTGTIIYSDASLTTVASFNASYISTNNILYTVTNAVVTSNGTPCESTTTTTTTSNVSQESAIGNFIANDACSGIGSPMTIYYTGTLGNGTALFLDPSLTVPYSEGFFPSGNGTYLRIYFQAQQQVCTMSGNIIQSYTAC